MDISRSNIKVCVLIPSYNEELTIGGVVKRIKDMGLEAVIVDDGSTDKTEEAASKYGALVLRNIKNQGKGAALREGFDFILRSAKYDAVVVMDGDGQHNPDDIGKFISRLRDHGDDIIVGNRMARPKNMPFLRLATNRFMSYLLSAICKQKIPDTQCGFKLIKCKVLKELRLEANNFDFDSEILIAASRRHFKIASVPVDTIYKGELSYINPLKDTVRFTRLLLKTRK